MKKKACAVATLGNNFEMILEIIGATNYTEKFDLYPSNIESIREYRRKICKIDTLFLLTTRLSEDNLEKIIKICINVNKIFSQEEINIKKIEIFSLDKSEDITDISSVISFQNMVYFSYIKAILEEKKSGKELYSFIAAGRKTMSSDLQKVAFIFGSDGNFHIISTASNSNRSSDNQFDINKFDNELEAENVIRMCKKYFSNFLPVYLGKFVESHISLDNKLISIYEEYKKSIKNPKLNFDFQENQPKILLNYFPEDFENNLSLSYIIQQKFESTFNYYSNSINTKEDCFRILFNYKKNIIQKLQDTFVGKDPSKKEEDLKILRLLPKTDLHCHLGGSLSVKDLIELSDYVLQNKKSIFNDDLPKSIEDYETIFKKYKRIKNYSINNKSDFIMNFINLFNKDELKLKKWIYNKIPEFMDNDNRVKINVFDNGEIDERSFRNIGINIYEALGDLHGTSILQSEEAITFCVKRIIDKSVKENVKHLEIRCSPVNYTREGLNEIKVLYTILEAMKERDDYYEKIGNPISLGLLIIGSRHGKLSDLLKNIELINDIYDYNENSSKIKHEDICRILSEKEIKSIRENLEKYFRGFDLAGDENVARPEDFRFAFLKIMDRCQNITIHAGETGDPKNIWEAIYQLNAERIGHALNIMEIGNSKKDELIKKIRERNIGIELCPSSNYQILNFHDNYFIKDNLIDFKNKDLNISLNDNINSLNIINQDIKNYPLKEYLDYGLRVSVNTDNPGISDTNITNELLKAARLSKKVNSQNIVEEGLNLWDILKLIKNGFKSSFVDHEKKRKLYEEAETSIKEFIEQVCTGL